MADISILQLMSTPSNPTFTSWLSWRQRSESVYPILKPLRYWRRQHEIWELQQRSSMPGSGRTSVRCDRSWTAVVLKSPAFKGA
jgi:hypothetical protein